MLHYACLIIVKRNQAYKIKVLRVLKKNLDANYSVAEGAEAQVTSRLLQACSQAACSAVRLHDKVIYCFARLVF